MSYKSNLDIFVGFLLNKKVHKTLKNSCPFPFVFLLTPPVPRIMVLKYHDDDALELGVACGVESR